MIKRWFLLLYFIGVLTFGLIVQETQPLPEVLVGSIMWPALAAGVAALEINKIHLLKDGGKGEER